MSAAYAGDSQSKQSSRAQNVGRAKPIEKSPAYAAPGFFSFLVIERAQRARQSEVQQMRHKKDDARRQPGGETGRGAQFTAENCTPNGKPILTHGAPVSNTGASDAGKLA